ncbi:MAG TPA: family 16 glycosylhydrolase [Ktedonobacteraceae bacterium]|nr:family 16 glycosylhydrolase [Ktedonobacteraceae bacterium]
MFDDFRGPLQDRWRQTCIGTGSLLNSETTMRMMLAATRQGDYSDAQIDDYGRLPRSQYPWRPPVRMEVRARSGLPGADPAISVEQPGTLRGTAGFGFWNYPFSVRGDVLMLPEAVWFFYASPPSNMALVPGVPGWGWKAQVVHSLRPGAAAAALPLAITAALGRLTGNSRPAGRWMQRLTGASEALLHVEMAEWHTYTLDWQPQEALFRVDGETVLRVANPPTRPLGFVAWLDNQYAIATPRGVLRFGALDCGPQWIELDSVRIDTLDLTSRPG